MPLLNRLGRIVTPGRRLIPQIDGLRFVAIAAVFYSVGSSKILRQSAAELKTELELSAALPMVWK